MAPKPHQVGKLLTEEGLQKDLGYVLHGIDCHHVLAEICPPRPGLVVLEAGSGSGKLSIWYAVRGAECTLLDVDDAALRYASELCRRVGQATGKEVDVELCLGSVLTMPHGELIVRGLDWTDTFDFVFNEGVPHQWGFNAHDTRRQHCLNEMVRVTKPGGWVCVIGSNGHCPATVKMAETTNHSYLGMPPRQLPWTKEELAQRLMKAGLDLKTLHVQPVSAPPSGLGADPLGLVESAWERAPLLAGWGQKP